MGDFCNCGGWWIETNKVRTFRRMLEDVERERSSLEENYRCSADHHTPRPARLSYCEGKADILKWVLEELENEKQR
jgi:hypothetical protein